MCVFSGNSQYITEISCVTPAPVSGLFSQVYNCCTKYCSARLDSRYSFEIVYPFLYTASALSKLRLPAKPNMVSSILGGGRDISHVI